MTERATDRNSLLGLLVLILMAAADTENGVLIKKDDALVGAVVSAAVGLAAYGLRKALSEGGGALPLRHHDDHDEAELDEKRGDGSLLSTVWGSASDSLLPLAEEAAEMAGKWVAKNSPALIRERLVPRFIDSFKAAA